jgi:hypothetical protein
MIDIIVFDRAVPVLGTSMRVDEFTADSGWIVAEVDGAVVLHRPADASRQLPEIRAFTVRGVGYCVAYAVPKPAIVAPAPPAKARKR